MVDSVVESAGRLRRAAADGLPCAPVRDLIGVGDEATAYAVQRENIAARAAAGARVVGRKVEAEIAFVLARDPDPGDVRSALGYALAALEIVDSRIAGWDITFGDTVADNASSGLFVLGSAQVPLDAFEPDLRLSTAHLARTSAEVVAKVVSLSGTVAIYRNHPLPSLLGDAIVPQQHAFMSPAMFDAAAAVLMGLPATVPAFR